MEQKESVMREYHFCLSRVQQLEKGFLELRSGLGEERQILLDEYIAAGKLRQRVALAQCHGCDTHSRKIHPVFVHKDGVTATAYRRCWETAAGSGHVPPAFPCRQGGGDNRSDASPAPASSVRKQRT